MRLEGGGAVKTTATKTVKAVAVVIHILKLSFPVPFSL